MGGRKIRRILDFGRITVADNRIVATRTVVGRLYAGVYVVAGKTGRDKDTCTRAPDDKATVAGDFESYINI